MKSNKSKPYVKIIGLVLLTVAMLSNSTFATQEIWLVAQEYDKDIPGPDGTVIDTVHMWGFAQADAGFNPPVGGFAPSSPGPLIDIPSDNGGVGPALVVHLRNDLPVTTSIMIPGLIASNQQPVRFAAGDFTPDAGKNAPDTGLPRSRIRSFAAECAPSGTVDYTYDTVPAGSYIYHSGTHLAVQVQMGLYGAIRKMHDDVTMEAYPGVVVDDNVQLFFSEIDPYFHNLIANNLYNPQTTSGSGLYYNPSVNAETTSTFDYKPKYFLINGEPYNTSHTFTAPGIPVNESLLVRMYNCGLQTRVPTLDEYLTLVSEDANALPFSIDKYSILLPAGKTKDAIWVPSSEGNHPLFDRTLATTTANKQDGGMLTYLNALAPIAGAPVAVDDGPFNLQEDSNYVSVSSVLANDTVTPLAPLEAVLEHAPQFGMVSFALDGTYTYTPNPNFSGADSFTYRARLTGTNVYSNIATVYFTVSPVNDAPVAQPDSYTVYDGQTNIVGAANGVLANDSDVDGDALTTQLVNAPSSGTLVLNADGSFQYTPNANTTADSFSYMAVDTNAVPSAVAVVTLTIIPSVNEPPVAVKDHVNVDINGSITFSVTYNDYDVDGSIVPSTITIVNPPVRGGNLQLELSGGVPTGRVIYAPPRNFVGSDVFTYTVEDNLGAVSNAAYVRLNVKR